MASQPGLALMAWGETLQRAGPPLDAELYGAMLAAANDAGMRAQLLVLARDQPALEIVWFQAAPPEEARAHLEEISAAVQRGTPEQRAAFARRAAEIAGTPGGH